MNAIIILIIVGVLSGMLSGLVGVGGGILIVPALVFFMKYDQLSAQGTSLAVLLLPVGIIAVYHYYQAGNININHALIISIGFVVGGYFGSKLAYIVPKETMKILFGIFMMIIALRFLNFFTFITGLFKS
jgi:uncharacterized membrane protein YfcA